MSQMVVLLALFALFLPLVSVSLLSLLLFLSILGLAMMSLNYFKVWNHVLLMLLTLEASMLTLCMVFGVMVSLNLVPLELFFSFFTLAVVEASVGVATLISFSRNSGSEFLSTMIIV